VYFHDAVVAAVRSAQPFAQERGATFATTLTQTSNGDAAVEVFGNPLLLVEMVEHVVCFALRFSPRGGKVELDVEVGADAVVMHVRDHGPEVAAERLEPASEWFHVLPGERGASGWGLDFSVARRLAELHRGTAALHDCASGGCESAIRLPRWRPTGGLLGWPV
jgi:signal transduction histidine kinase